ncbi:U32 family peptidase [Ruminococcus flavefaciens]|uniref:Putative protease n=1 Tax=Ruminococcus flavefaciens TaxID=1265 RepID=A0A1M7J7G6_RUMFL|nr:U32 family peptidase [Ruminococcus flavefaciens]SHM48902.1 putative protease [Ruminococcus flavefaciens]
MNKTEILAPAGSMETLQAALRSGADAVYIGGKRYSARSSAANFSMEEIAEAAGLCHKYGAKLDLAVNTIISDEEAEDFCEYIKAAAKCGVDAFIVQDWGCAELIRRCVPDAVLHGSTQMSVHTAEGASLLRELGYARVVPARELDKDTISRICKVGIETEIFVHGALCMSVSGQCYMSAMIGSRSANRGCCGQACRLPFSAVGNKSKAALSLKDLSLLPNAQELAEMGVDSFKIEGRMKRPEYVASAVHELRSALDGEAPNMKLLRGVFSRSGFTDGYYTAQRKDMFGVREKDDVISAHELIPKIHELYRFERKAFTADFHAVIKSGEPVRITASCGDISASAEGDIPQQAINRPTDAEMLTKQLSKLGDTVFTFGKLTADIDEGLIVPAGKLNELRREVSEKLSDLIISANTPAYTITEYLPKLSENNLSPMPSKLPVRTFCRTAQQAFTAAELSEYVIIPEELINEELLGGVDREKIIASPPRFITNGEKLADRLAELKEMGINRLYCHTPDHIAIGRKSGYKLHGSFTLNVFNSFSAEYLHDLGLEDCIFSIEATLQQIARVNTSLPIGAAVYGRLPLMLTRNCPIKNEVGCGKCTKKLIDRTGRELPVACSKDYVEILNADRLSMLDRTDELSNISFGVAYLSDETADEIRSVLSGRKPQGNITRGLYYRGI